MKKKPRYVVQDLVTGYYFKSIGWRNFDANNLSAYKAIFVADINDAKIIISNDINNVKSWFAKYMIIDKTNNNRVYYPVDICERTVKILTVLDP